MSGPAAGRRRAALAWTAGLAALAGLAAPRPAAAAELTIAVDTQSAVPISPYLFGLGSYAEKDRDAAGVWQLRPTLYRFGGNTAERYNWKLNAYNAASDYFFLNVGLAPERSVDRFLAANADHGVASAVVLPLLGWVAKDAASAGFPLKDFPAQQLEAQDGKGIGNGLGKDGRALPGTAARTSTPAGPEFLAAWTAHLAGRFGKGPHFYILGNEPMLWAQTHRDVHPEPTTYDEYLATYLAAATAVRRADPAAVLVGPAEWGWLSVFDSAFDNAGPWSGGAKGADKARHGNVGFLEWFVTQVAKREAQLGTSLLDVLDVHFYPSDLSLYHGGPYDAANRELRLAATRALWDRRWRDTGWIKQPVYFVPLLKEIIARTKPALKLAIGEYNFKGEDDLGGGLALAETLRVLIGEGVYMAEYWTEPPSGSPAAAAFRLYRNYDGKGTAFGDERLLVDHDNRDDLTAVAARAGADRRVTVVLVNKASRAERRLRLKLARFDRFVKSVTTYTLSAAEPTGLRAAAQLAAKELSLALPPLSATLVEFRY